MATNNKTASGVPKPLPTDEIDVVDIQGIADKVEETIQNIDLLKPGGGSSAGNTVTAYIDSILNNIPNNTISLRSAVFGNGVRRILMIDRRTNQVIVLAISHNSIEQYYRTVSGEWTSRTANLS